MKIRCNINYLQEPGCEFLMVGFHINQMQNVLLAFNALMLCRISKLELIGNQRESISVYLEQDKLWMRCEATNCKCPLSEEEMELILSFCVDAILTPYEGIHVDLELDDLNLTFLIE